MTPGGRVDLTLSGTSSFGADNSTLGAVLMQMNTAQASELFGDRRHQQRRRAGRRRRRRRPPFRRAGRRRGADGRGRRPRDRARRDDARSSPTRSTSSATSCSDSAASRCSCRSSSSTTPSRIVLGQRTPRAGAAAHGRRRPEADPAFGRSARRSSWACSPRPAGSAAASPSPRASTPCSALMGVDLSDYPLILAPRTLIAAAVIGIGVTLRGGDRHRHAGRPRCRRSPLLARWRRKPAASARTRVGHRRRAVRRPVWRPASPVSPASARRRRRSPRWRSARSRIFLGVTVLSPLAVGGVTGVFGWPMREIAGVAGRLAQRNAARNPRRTATTAAALMIGLALVIDRARRRRRR